MKQQAGGGRARAAISISAISARQNNLFEELEDAVPRLRRDRPRQDPPLPAQRRGGRALQAGAGHLHGLGGHSRGHGPAVLRGPARRRGDAARSTSRSMPICIIGVVPIINLEWIQKLHRDKETRGYSTEAVVDTILRRMPDYVNYICPQFSQTHVNFQRVPDRRHLESVHRALHPDAPTRASWSSASPNPEGHRLSLSAVHAARLLHVAAQHHRLPGRQDGAGDAAHLDAHDPEADGRAPPGAGRAARARSGRSIGARTHSAARAPASTTMRTQP